MTLIKHDIPILEFDADKEAVIMPNTSNVELPKKAVYAFLGEEIDRYALANQAKVVAEFDSITKTYPIYVIKHKGEEVCLVQAPCGSASSAQILDWLIGHGVEAIISGGSCGVLVDLPENIILVPKRALRDEGASYHYLAPSRFIDINQQALNAIEKTLQNHHLSHQEVTTWTTDGFFRETKKMVEYRKSEGCEVVDMECSALAACAKMRNVIWGQILFTADTLANIDEYDARSFGKDTFSYNLQLCLDAVLEI